MGADIQLVVTFVSTIVASGAIWQLIRLRSDVEQVRALTRKVEAEAHALELQQLRATADFYYAQWQRCLAQREELSHTAAVSEQEHSDDNQ